MSNWANKGKQAATVDSKRRKDNRRQQGPPFSLHKDPQNPNFEDGLDAVVNLLKGRKNIAVLLGAGISVSCGIPDFRTAGSGIYSTLDAEELGLSCPEELFELSFFKENPRPFYRFARHLYFPLGDSERVRPSDSHKLLALLDQKKMLRRCYSQNIDGLEEVAGVSPKNVVCAHGSLRWATCCKCKRKVSSTELEKDIKNGTVPYCQAAAASIRINTKVNNETLKVAGTSIETIAPLIPPRVSSRKRPRTTLSSSDSSSDGSGASVCGGVMKPSITFFGEALNNNVKRCLEADRNKVDALIVIGTSLSVAPISKVVGYLPPNIPRILINRTIVHPKHAVDEDVDTDKGDGSENEKDFREGYVFDAYLLGYCDDVTRVLGKHLFSTPSTNSARQNENESTKGRLLATLSDDDVEFSAKDWKASTNVPFDRVFLFPGAQTPSMNKDVSYSNKEFEEPAYREVVYCDGCGERVLGTIQKCITCFDYDLCQKCFPALSKTHYGGNHHFIREKSSPI